jgi:hypothetical protein
MDFGLVARPTENPSEQPPSTDGRRGRRANALSGETRSQTATREAEPTRWTPHGRADRME